MIVEATLDKANMRVKKLGKDFGVDSELKSLTSLAHLIKHLADSKGGVCQVKHLFRVFQKEWHF